ncbi:ATP-binding protein [Halobacteriovorax sp. HLS]|uniref:GAF domain-containing sensor histidine kinase n=1 Tax=Halobacteriovorax sp. HLS TaxID=2234000 RepID=UPI000FD897D5|nr:ATP-binding protein [Halobacteriovorax sp. HLS]
MDLLSKINIIAKTLFNTTDPNIALERSLASLGELLQVDNIWLVKNVLDEAGSQIQLEPYSEWYLNEEIGRINFDLLAGFTYEEIYDYYSIVISRGEPLFGNSSNFTFKSKKIGKYYKDMGMKSFIVVPIFYDSFHWGNLVLLDFNVERQWDSLAQAMTLISSIFGAHIRNMEFRDSINEEYVSDHGKKMATLGEMAAGIVHEINNPLFIINGFATKINNLIERDQLDKYQLMNISEMIQKNCKRVTSIISGLRMISRKTKLDELEVKSLKDIIESTIDISRERIRLADIDLKINFPDGDDFPVECHPEQLSQVLVNLFNNSYDSICENDGSKWIDLSLKDLGDRFLFSVTDSGSSIPNEIAQKIMQPFFTTKESGKGTGLGLSISKEIVSKHGGNFYLDQSCSNVKFIIELPKLEYE